MNHARARKRRKEVRKDHTNHAEAMTPTRAALAGKPEDARSGGGARAGAALSPSKATEFAVRGPASPVLLDDERLTLLLLDLDASEGVAHHLLHESPAHDSLDRGLLGRGACSLRRRTR